MYYQESKTPHEKERKLIKICTNLAGIAIEQRNREEALHQSEERYRILYEDNPTMYFTVSVTGKVLSVNQFGAHQLGYTVEELVGQSVLSVFFSQDQDHVKNQMKHCLQFPHEIGHWEARKVRKDGSLLWVKETVRVVNWAQEQPVLLIVCEDITEQKHVQQVLQSSEKAIRELYEVTASPIPTFEHRIRALLDVGCRRFNLSMGLLTRQCGDKLQVQYAHPQQGFIREGAVVPVCDTFCSHALRSPDPIMIARASESEWESDPGYTNLGLEAYFGTRVLVDNQIYGTLCFVGKNPHIEKFTEADTDFLMLMARWVEEELERDHTEEALRINEQSIRDLYEVTSSREMSFDQKVQALMQLGCRRFQLPIGVLTCLEGQNLKIKASYGSTGEFPPGSYTSIQNTLCQQTLQADGPVIFERVDETPYSASTFSRGKKVHTYMGTPLRVGKALFGTFCFLSPDEIPTQYSKADRNFLQLMAQWLGNEMERQQDESSNRNMNLALSKAMPGITKLNKDGRYVEVNSEYAKMLGYQPSELIGVSWEQSVYSADLPIPYAAYQTMLKEGQSEFECRAVRKDGSIFYKHVMLVKAFNHQGQHIGHHCFMRDITDRKYSEEALRESEGRLQSILDNSSTVIYVKDLEGKYLLINRKYETIFNLTRESVKGKTDFDIFPHDIAKAFSENDHKVIQLREPMEREEVAPHQDGLHTYNSNKFLLQHADGTPYALCGISTDISQRKEAEKNTRLHKHILESSPNGILITDFQQPDNPVIFCNAAFERLPVIPLMKFKERIVGSFRELKPPRRD